MIWGVMQILYPSCLVVKVIVCLCLKGSQRRQDDDPVYEVVCLTLVSLPF